MSGAEDPIGVGALAALFAGLVSFVSPCVLPLVPGYLSAVTGVAVSDLDRAGPRQVLVPSLLFILSFSTIFVLLGLGASGVGSFFRDHRDALNHISGVLIVLMGIVFAGSALSGRLSREFHVGALMTRAGSGGPLVAGAAFAVAWTPCIGPTLASILSLASASSPDPARGGFLLGVYSAGLAIPFLATALAFSRATTASDWLKRHYAAIIGLGGLTLIVMGVLVFTGELFQLNIEAQKLLDSLGLNFFSDV